MHDLKHQLCVANTTEYFWGESWREQKSFQCDYVLEVETESKFSRFYRLCLKLCDLWVRNEGSKTVSMLLFKKTSSPKHTFSQKPKVSFLDMKWRKVLISVYVSRKICYAYCNYPSCLGIQRNSNTPTCLTGWVSISLFMSTHILKHHRRKYL